MKRPPKKSAFPSPDQREMFRRLWNAADGSLEEFTRGLDAALAEGSRNQGRKRCPDDFAALIAVLQSDDPAETIKELARTAGGYGTEQSRAARIRRKARELRNDLRKATAAFNASLPLWRDQLQKLEISTSAKLTDFLDDAD